MGSRLYLRLLSVALLVLFLPVAGIWTLQSFERELLASEERTMAMQAASVAAWCGSLDAFDAVSAAAVVDALPRPIAGRIRIVAGDGAALTDTAEGDLGAAKTGESADAVRNRPLYRLGAFLWRAKNLFGSESGGDEEPEPDDVSAIARALAGGYGAHTRPSADGSATVLTIALPIRTPDGVIGAVVVSRTTATTLAALDRIRIDLFRVVVLSVIATALIALLLARGLVAPLLRLRDAADRALGPASEESARFPETRRRDEIGDLARSLAALHNRLDRRVGELEAFASDVAHEVRNPLAAIRSAAELLPGSTSEEERARLVALMGTEVTRVDQVVSALQELARIDARRPPEGGPHTNLSELVESVGAAHRIRAPAGIEIDGPPVARVAMPAEAAVRVVENLVENAVSFSPSDGIIRIQVRERGDEIELTVSDDGPGVPPEHRERIFERFFSWRPERESARHLGLGLAIARALVEREGGTIALDPATVDTPGATFRVRLPRA